MELLKGLGLGLDENAVRAVALWRFQPATRHGVAVPFRINVSVRYWPLGGSNGPGDGRSDD